MMNDGQVSLEGLKEQLGDALKSQTVDFGAILKLASEISLHDMDVVRFSTDAAMVRRLGRELVARQETALAELVKNAYDADALRCEVNLHGSGAERWLEIVDDGSGMTRDELVSGFMRLASDAKVRAPVSRKFGRARAGKKGIGRFATERLGGQLTIVTRAEGEPSGWQVDVDWTDFAAGEDIGLVPNHIRRSDEERIGTRLIIRSLNDDWTEARLRRVYRYLSTLLQPFFGDDELRPQSQAEADDPGFAPEISSGGRTLDEEDTVIDFNTEVLGLALAEIDATIDASGNASWSMRSERIGLTIPDQPIGLNTNQPAPLAAARNATLKAFYYIRSSEFLGHSLSFIRDQLAAHGGIRLYRNGYRVAPYGERDDDWLRLDYKNTTTYAPINSKVFLGFVAVTDETGSLYDETSSREGLVETEAFEELRDLMSRVLEIAVRRIEAERGGRGRTRRPPSGAASGAEASAETGDALSELEGAVSAIVDQGLTDDGSRERVRTALQRLNAAASISAEVARERDALLEELNLLRILASMGLTMAEFTHDFSALAQTMELSVADVERHAEAGGDGFKDAIALLTRQFQMMRGLTNHLGTMMARNTSRDLVQVELYDFVRRFADDLAPMFNRRGRTLTVERPVEYDILTTKMHRSEWSSILLNLLTNAIKAADRVHQPGAFHIRVGKLDGDRVFLDFSDDGDGIPVENRERVFDAFFTTSGGSPLRAPETVQSIGTGLGLKIVADIVQAVKGEAIVIGPAPGYATTIRVIVPGGALEEEAA